ncbi:YggS family pyridoxal phosphate-dependent enzyme [Lysinibacillus sp. 2017]|uniref:YggS family pyridoxal phosphate-dependent enzyme n=1 Tax=unclassified Lysinibacillus TaxID=2636778 RepID=UPI000D52A5E4|nr:MULTISPECIES: YggS family pyridoxal phosphate-dependent enzyme [unclassified Lysinibacillus]AWE06592.1 YggS family pyridoxal phosphate-dependent enzyme [Lysinibacillus sp. 2017]TGN35371.1 YggS family pyridoxal phosphate-dependent enzyme [Lysinibacillus sp. S2017]
MAKIVNNLEIIQNNIEQAKQRSNAQQAVNIIAVTKQVDVARTQEAIEAGLVNLGENRPEGLESKLQAIQSTISWHYIGSLQTRKVKQIINEIDYLHSLDRLSLAEEIEKRATKKVKCFVQANVSGEDSKHGLTKEQTLEFVKQLEKFSKIEVVGLMTMAPFTEDESVIRHVFQELKQLQQEVAQLNLHNVPCTELSMGMSNDYEIAVEEGATFVRIGTALVG